MLNITYKIYAMIFRGETESRDRTEKDFRGEQAGFRSDRSTINNILILNLVSSKLQVKGRKLYAFLADLTPAFEKVNREKLSRIMEEKEISKKLRMRLDEIYKEIRNEIRVNEKLLEKFWTTRGLRQECLLSPTLFLLYTADLEKKMKRIQIGGVAIEREKI